MSAADWSKKTSDVPERMRMQTELLDRRKWATIVELSMEMANYIDAFNIHQRRHSSLDMLSPTERENQYAPTPQLT